MLRQTEVKSTIENAVVGKGEERSFARDGEDCRCTNEFESHRLHGVVCCVTRMFCSLALQDAQISCTQTSMSRHITPRHRQPRPSSEHAEFSQCDSSDFS